MVESTSPVGADEKKGRQRLSGTFFLGSSHFSVFEEMARQLQQTSIGGGAWEGKPRSQAATHTEATPTAPEDDEPEKDTTEKKLEHPMLDDVGAKGTTTSSPAQAAASPDGKEQEDKGSDAVSGEHNKDMRRRIRWRKRSADFSCCDIVLGDRFNIKYATLRCAKLPASGTIFGGIRWIHYFQGSHQLTLKTSMALILKKEDPAGHPAYLPESYVLGGDLTKKPDEHEDFLEAVRCADRDEACLSMWIVKPSAGAKGRGIWLLRGAAEAEQVVQEVLSSKAHTGPKGVRCLAQAYVPRPLLLKGRRKFDVRIWVLLQSPYTIYAYSQGSCRTASTAYDPTDMSNRLAHLTNHCLQEHAEGYGAYEENNELFFPALDAYLKQSDLYGSEDGGEVLRKRILPQMANIIVRTLLVMKPTLQLLPEDESSSFRCFQLFGYDLLVTEDLSVKLLEINGSPGVAQRFLCPLVRDMTALLYRQPSHSAANSESELWEVEKEAFVLLWRDGEDPFPPGRAGFQQPQTPRKRPPPKKKNKNENNNNNSNIGKQHQQQLTPQSNEGGIEVELRILSCEVQSSVLYTCLPLLFFFSAFLLTLLPDCCCMIVEASSYHTDTKVLYPTPLTRRTFERLSLPLSSFTCCLFPHPESSHVAMEATKRPSGILGTTSKKKPSSKVSGSSAKPKKVANKVFSSLYDNAVVDTASAVAANPFKAREVVTALPPAPAAPVNPITIDLSQPKEILSHAQRRALKKPVRVVTKEMKEAAKEAKKEERRMKRMLKSNGARRKVAKLVEKRSREESQCEEAMQAFDADYQPRSKGRRLE
eukprot:gene10301-7203_t